MKFTTFPQNIDIFNKKGVVKFGIDPSGSSLHLGHLLPLKMVKLLKDNGCDIHIVLGTFTSTIGDATGRDSTRPILGKEIVAENAKLILSQVKRILGDDITIHYNNKWFDEMKLPKIMSVLSNFTVQDLLNRDSFQNRIQNGSTISMQELIYPLLQGIDSVMLNSYIEVGGQDQLLNMIKGRELQVINNTEPQICVMTELLSIGNKKMSKSSPTTCIFMDDTPQDVFGKAMSISDDTMHEWQPTFFESIDENKHPMIQKKELALKITTDIWGENLANDAYINFENTIQNRELPTDIPELPISDIVDVVKLIINGSKSEARRLIIANAVKINGEKATEVVTLKSGDVIKVGKLKYAKIV